MAMVYVAFDGDKDRWADSYMKGWKTSRHGDFDFEDAHDLDEMTSRAQNEQYVKSMLKGRMKQSEALVVLVDESTENLFKFVRWEIELAREMDIPIILANLNNKTEMDPDRCPAILRNECPIHVPFKMRHQVCPAGVSVCISKNDGDREGTGLALLQPAGIVQGHGTLTAVTPSKEWMT
jgi:hypothetical protein